MILRRYRVEGRAVKAETITERTASNCPCPEGKQDGNNTGTVSHADVVGLINVRCGTVGAVEKPRNSALEPTDIERIAVAFIKIPGNDALENVVVGDGEIAGADDLDVIKSDRVVTVSIEWSQVLILAG